MCDSAFLCSKDEVLEEMVQNRKYTFVMKEFKLFFSPYTVLQIYLKCGFNYIKIDGPHFLLFTPLLTSPFVDQSNDYKNTRLLHLLSVSINGYLKARMTNQGQCLSCK